MKYDKNIYKVYVEKDKNIKHYHNIPYLKKKDIDDENDIYIVGMTKLKRLKKTKKQKTDILQFKNKNYIVKNKVFGFTKGYISVGNNRYIQIKRKYFFLLILLLLLFLLNLDIKEPYKIKNLDPIKPIVDEIITSDDNNTLEDKGNKRIRKSTIKKNGEKESIFSIDYKLDGGILENPINEYKKGSLIELPIPIKKGYTFEGWYLEKNLKTGIKKITKEMAKDLVLYAKWKVIDYKITYELNGGTLENQITSYTIESEDFALDIPMKVGYEFLGWTTKENGTLKKEVTITQGTVGNITFIANWKVIEYNISYNLNEGNIENKVDSYNIESPKIEIDKPTRTGYAFIGWTNETINNPKKNLFIEAGTIGDISLNANWRLQDYSIYYKLNGGILEKARSIYNMNTENFNLGAPIKKGYDFMGWTGSNGSKLNKEIIIRRGTIGHLFFSANWRLVDYDINYELNGGILKNQITSYTIESDDFNLGIPTKPGYEFLGWTTKDNDTLKKEVTITQGTVGNITFIANWKPIKYSIDYKLNGGTLENQITSYTVESETFSLGTPTKKGYDFIGWTDKAGNVLKSIAIEKGTMGDLSFIANWKIRTHTVTYKNANGSYYSSQTVNYNAQVPMIGYPVDYAHVFNGWLYGNNVVVGLAMPDNDMTLIASVRETSCYLITGQAQDGDNSRISRFQELLLQKGLGGRWNLEETGYYDYFSDASNYSHVLDAANHLLANASSGSWPSLRWLYMTCDNGYEVQLR